MECTSGRYKVNAPVEKSSKGRPNKVRIISNVRVIPPTSSVPPVEAGKFLSDREDVSSDNWIRVDKRGAKASTKRQPKPEGGNLTPGKSKARMPSALKPKPKTDILKRKAPKGSVVAITGREEGFSYAEALKTARENISLDKIGIDRSRIRRAANGGVLIEITGLDSEHKADQLANQLNELIGTNANVTRPIAKGDVKVCNIDDSVSPSEVCLLLAEIEDCPQNLIRTGDLRQQRNGMNSIMINCPLHLAIKVARMGKIRLGWSMASIELLKRRLTKCYKCWHFDHLKNTCNSVKDRQDCYFKCGDKGHNYTKCTNPYKCWVCFDTGLDGFHRSGSNDCPTYCKLVQARGALKNSYGLNG